MTSHTHNKAGFINEALRETESLRHELEIFMKGVANWFETHPRFIAHPPVVHSVRMRLKDPKHLRKKLERKWNPDDPICRSNVFARVTDLAGVRVIHLHQKQFEIIHQCISDKIDHKGDWILNEAPKAYTWDPESKHFFEGFGLECTLKESSYTSVHYVVRPRHDSPVSCEIQVRTLFEEIWGEVDHTVNYPEPSRSIHCREQLKVLAKLVGAGSRLVDSIFTTASGSKPKVYPAEVRGKQASG